MSSTDVVLKNPPCFRSGLMWGIGMGVAVGAHRFRITKSARKACDGAIFAFGLVGSGSWCGKIHLFKYMLKRF